MSRSPSPVIRRPVRTYGRRRDTSEHDISFDVGNTSLDSREDSLSSTSITLDHEVPPSSDDFDASNTSSLSAQAANADDSDEDEDADNAPGRYRFAFRDMLDKIDRGESDSATRSNTQGPHGELSSEGKASVPTRPASPADEAARGVLSGTLSSLTASAQSSSLVIHTRPPRRVETLPPSEPESEAEARPSTPQTSPRHPINTPETRSSPTPPTSIEMPPSKGKGKGKQRDANPLPFESADDLTSNAKPATSKQQKKPKASGAAKRVKAPTKKDRIETQKANARIVAQQPVSIQPQQKSKYRISTLLEKFQPGLIQREASRSRSRTRTRSPSPPIPVASDPIQPFSSSPATDTRSRRPTASSSKAVSQSEFQPNGLLGTTLELTDTSDSDSDLPDGAALMRESAKNKEAAEKLRQAKELKARVLAQRNQHQSEESDDDLVIASDPKNVARDEAQSRRGLTAKGVLPSRGRKTHLAFAGATAHRESAVLRMDEEEQRRVMKDAASASFVASKAKRSDKQVHLSPKALSRILLAQDANKKARIIQEKEEDYKRRGGRLKERPEEHALPQNPHEALQRLKEKGAAAASRDGDIEMVDDSGSDEEYRPDDAVVHEGSDVSDEENDEDGENAPLNLSRGDLGEQADDEDDENPFLAPRPRCPLANRPIAAVVSDDEDDAENRPPPSRILVRDSSQSPQAAGDDEHALARRQSTSSLGEQTDRTEDGTDKENDVRLSFDRGDDKENTTIAVQSPGLSLGLRPSRGFGSLFAAEIAASPGASRSVPEGVRSPLKELPADEEDEDVFGFSPGPLRLSSSTTAVAGAGDDSPMDLSLGGGGGLQEAFSLSAKGKERAPSPSPLPLAEALPIGGGGGFSQFFTQEGGGGFEKLKAAQQNDDISLTLDTGLQPALEVDQGLAAKADQIFEKEQVLAVQEQQETRASPARKMFVDDNGFLTQTRPELRTPLSAMTPSQPMPSLRLSSPATLLASVRKPLAPLFGQGPDDDDDDLPRLRLKKRDRTPPPQPSPPRPKARNAFDVLGRRPSPAKAKKPKKSAFIEGEAEESDEDAAFGFGGRKQDSDEEDSDDDAQDQPLAELVDDKEMDDQTLAEQAVLEKYREHGELDDKAREKAARDAATGKLRIKRRDHGVGFGDSDSDEDSDGGRPRPAKKKPRLNDSIAALSKDKETAPFAQEYNANVDDDDDEFAYLKQDEMEMDVPEPAEEDEEPREVISHAQLREEMLQRARESESAPVFDPHDVSRWDDQSEDEMDDGMRVREVSLDQRRDAAGRLAGYADGDEPLRKDDFMGEEDRARMKKWGKAEGGSRTAGILGRNTGGSAVTGHGKSKAGGGSGSGSFKEGSRPSASRTASCAGAGGRTKVAKAPSVLSAVSSRRAKFAN